MIKIYKYDPRSNWLKDVVNDSTLKGEKRDIAIENAIKEHGIQISIVEYFKDWNRNNWNKDYYYNCYGEIENSIERLANAEIHYDEDLAYLSAKNNHPEDLIEDRTHWNEMKDYADGLYRFIDSLVSDIVSDKISIPQDNWRSSDEQMKFLWKYAEQNNYDGRILASLYNDLKKL